MDKKLAVLGTVGAVAIIATWCNWYEADVHLHPYFESTIRAPDKLQESADRKESYLRATTRATTRARDELQKRLQLEVQLDELRKQLDSEAVGHAEIVDRQPRVADNECKWWQAPVIVGGSEGSGTRGAVTNVGSQGAHIMGTDAACKALNHAIDTSCITPKSGVFARGAWRSEVGPQKLSKKTEYPKSLQEVFAATRNPNSTRKAMLGLHVRNKRPWGWTWKMPHTMFQFPDLLKVFPCAHYVHALRDPRDLAAKPEAHTFIRVHHHLFTVASALGFSGTLSMTRQAGAFLCGHAQTRARGNNSIALCRQYLQAVPLEGIPQACCGTTTRPFIHRILTEPDLQRAIQCATLLSWQSNSLFHRWARAVLPHRAYLPYQIELSGEGAWGLAAPQREAVRALMSLEASTYSHRRGKVRQRRALNWQRHIGKWHRMISRERMRELEHCGNWKDMMQDMYRDAVETAVDARTPVN